MRRWHHRLLSLWRAFLGRNRIEDELESSVWTVCSRNSPGNGPNSLASALFGLTGHDGETLRLVAVALGATSLVAVSIPAARAALTSRSQ